MNPMRTNRIHWDRIQSSLSRPVDNTTLILFRVFFGFLMICECWGAIALGWVGETFVDVRHTFSFFGFEWTDILLGRPMYAYYAIMGLLSAAVMLGYRYRWSMALLSLMWALSYFMQKSHYNNHYYLVVLISAWMIFMPAHRWWSLDVKSGRTRADLSCPKWVMLYFQWQIAIVYFFAAIAKIYPDWLAGRPIQIWMQHKTHYPIIGKLLEQDWMAYVIAYGGIAYDGLIIPLLIWPRTRIFAIGISLVFHLFNSAVFQVGIFPYFALVLALFYFPPDQIRKWFWKKKPVADLSMINEKTVSPVFSWFFIGYFIIQIILPLRHHFIPGNVLWDEAGHRLSWRMMLRSKSAWCRYTIIDDDGKSQIITPRKFLAQHQLIDAASKPDMIYRSLDYLKEYLAEKGVRATTIYCDCKQSINGRPYVPLVDPEYNMMDAEWNYWGRQEWIAPEQWIEQ